MNQIGVRYIISGSVAAILYGEPRMTHDVDFVVFLNDEIILRLADAFPAPEFYLPPPSIIALEVARERRGHFNVIHADTGFKADFYTSGGDELHAWAFRNARRLEYQGEQMVVAPPEYVIVRKLEYFREGGSGKHLRDIRAMIHVSGEEIDRDMLNRWIRRLNLEQSWQQLEPELGSGS